MDYRFYCWKTRWAISVLFKVHSPTKIVQLPTSNSSFAELDFSKAYRPYTCGQNSEAVEDFSNDKNTRYSKEERRTSKRGQWFERDPKKRAEDKIAFRISSYHRWILVVIKTNES